jgi:uncharacterized protein DUF4279
VTADDGSVTPIRQPEVLAEVGGVIDETRVTLGIHGPDLEPNEISSLLGCAPTSAHRRGDPRRNGIAPWPQGAWLLSVEGKAPTEPEELIELLIDRLPSESAIWEQLAAKYTVRITLGLFTGDWNRGFELSPATVSRLAAIGARVGFDIYADQEENED